MESSFELSHCSFLSEELGPHRVVPTEDGKCGIALYLKMQATHFSSSLPATLLYFLFALWC